MYGLEYYRNKVVDFESETKNRTHEFWKGSYYKYKSKETNEFEGTICKTYMRRVKRYLLDFFGKHPKLRVDILEIGGGNGFNTKLVFDSLSELGSLDVPKEFKLISTDLFEYETKYYQVESDILSHEAVKKYSGQFNILLMISPMYNSHGVYSYMDYYAIKEFELIDMKEIKYIIFIGELGASDGTVGMYKYMLESSYWRLIYRNKVNVCEQCIDDYYCDYDNIEKEFFIFDNQVGKELEYPEDIADCEKYSYDKDSDYKDEPKIKKIEPLE